MCDAILTSCVTNTVILSSCIVQDKMRYYTGLSPTCEAGVSMYVLNVRTVRNTWKQLQIFLILDPMSLYLWAFQQVWWLVQKNMNIYILWRNEVLAVTECNWLIGIREFNSVQSVSRLSRNPSGWWYYGCSCSWCISKYLFTVRTSLSPTTLCCLTFYVEDHTSILQQLQLKWCRVPVSV